MGAIAFPVPQATILARRDAILAGLADILPPDCLITSENERRAYETDAFTAYRRVPMAVALPRNTAEVAAVLAYCHAEGVPVVPRGAGTSLAGGAIPQEDVVVIGVSKMNRILEIDYANRFARVEAGVTNLAITNAVSAEGFFYAPDPSSQLACTIGGNIGMNSGGAHCLKYGVTTNNIMGVKLVLVDGTVVEIGGEALDAPGYDLLGLICGSEGQLGIITEATVRILRAAEGARPVLFGFPTSEQAGEAVAAIIAAGIVPVAMEFMDKPAIEICEAFAKAGYPMDVEALLIIEVEGSDSEMDATLARIVEIAKAHGVKTVKESKSATETAAIWKGRKSAFGATGRIADYICMDGTIPTGQLPYVLKRIAEIVKHYGLRVANVFHAGDGNLHPLILYNVNDPGEAQKAEDAGNDILKLCVEVGGCLTGEHGVGIEKRDLMHHQFNREDLQQQLRVRAAFDAQWIMNPAKVFPLDGRGGMIALHRPETEADVASLVLEARRLGAPLALEGGGTRRGLGRPVNASTTLCLSRMSGITLYEPAEMVIGAKAGTPVRDVEMALAEKGQMLSFEPPDYRVLFGSQGEPTMGTLAAGNLSGSRRLWGGACRDSLIGVRFVNGLGEVIKSGGRVMKNVTGLDLVKLQAGAWGTLGVLTEVTFKVVPKPEITQTLGLTGLDDATAITAMSLATASPFEMTGAAHIPARNGHPARTILRLEGFGFSVEYRAKALAELLRAHGNLQAMPDAEANTLWRDLSNGALLAEPRDRAIWRLSVKPGEAAKAVAAIRASRAVDVAYDWAGGLIWLSTPEEGDGGAAIIRQAARAARGYATLLRGSEALRASVPVFEPEAAPIAALSRRIKASFDPDAVLNPGKMHAGL